MSNLTTVTLTICQFKPKLTGDANFCQTAETYLYTRYILLQKSVWEVGKVWRKDAKFHYVEIILNSIYGNFIYKTRLESESCRYNPLPMPACSASQIMPSKDFVYIPKRSDIILRLLKVYCIWFSTFFLPIIHILETQVFKFVAWW